MQRYEDVLPNFVIAGAPKSGTSSVHTWLADHPDALGSTEKETYFFVDAGTHMYRPSRHISRGIQGYSQFFRMRAGTKPIVILESTPSYMYHDTALRHLPVIETRPKFLFILREPAAQIYSLFNYFKNNWTWIPHGMEFAEYVECVRRGCSQFNGNELAQKSLRFASYVAFLERWREAVGEERMQVRLFDEILADEAAFTKSIANWLGLDSKFYDTYSFPRDNETYVIKSEKLQQVNVAMRRFLPKGSGYNFLRRLYRWVNTSAAREMAAADRDVLRELRNEFASSNARLSDSFGLDVSGWGK